MTHDKLQVFLSDREPRLFQGITYLKELWRPDLFDVPAIHEEARARLEQEIELLAREEDGGSGRILVLLGEGGSGKTHLLRAFRNEVHGEEQGFVAHLSMSTGLEDYQLYILRQIIDSWEDPYWAPYSRQQSCLTKLVRELAALLPPELVTQIEESEERGPVLAEAVDHLLDRPGFDGVSGELLHVLLHLLVDKRSVRNRVYKYLRLEPGINDEYARSLTGAQSVEASPEEAKRRLVQLAEIVRALPDRKVLSICVDQFEDFFHLDETVKQRFRTVTETLRNLAESMPGTLFVVSILGSFWSKLREGITTTTLTRFEHEPRPVHLSEARTRTEVEALVDVRLRHLWQVAGFDPAPRDELDPAPFDRAQLAKLAGTSARGVLLACQEARARSQRSGTGPQLAFDPEGVGTGDLDPPFVLELAQAWNDHFTAFPTPADKDEGELAETLARGLDFLLAETERSGTALAASDRILVEDANETLLTGGFCEKDPRFGHLQRQIEGLVRITAPSTAVILRTRPFPTNPSSQIRKYLDALTREGHDHVVVKPSDLRAIEAMEVFLNEHEASPHLSSWLTKHRPLSEAASALSQLLELLEPSDLSRETTSPPRPVPPTTPPPTELDDDDEPTLASRPANLDETPTELPKPAPSRPSREEALETPSTGIVVGYKKGLGGQGTPVELDPAHLGRHGVFLGAPGSGKTTAALRVVEELLLRGVPAILVDRKGDLASYAIEAQYRGPEAQTLRDRIDVQLYTPGSQQGRPVQLPLIPGRVPPEELDEASTHAAFSVGALRGWKPSDEGKIAAVKVAIEALATHVPEQPIHVQSVMEALFDPDVRALQPGLDKEMDKVGKELETMLILKRKQLFDPSHELLDPAVLLGPGREGRTRLNIISTAFLDANAGLFWLSQMLGMLHRHLQRVGAPSGRALNGVLFLDEADIYIPAVNQKKPATKDPLYKGLMQWRAFGFGVLMATQSPGNLDGKVRDQVSTWFLGNIQNKSSLGYLEPVLEGSGLRAASALPPQRTGDFVLRSESGTARIKATPNLVRAKPVPQDTLAALAREGRPLETKSGQRR